MRTRRSERGASFLSLLCKERSGCAVSSFIRQRQALLLAGGMIFPFTESDITRSPSRDNCRSQSSIAHGLFKAKETSPDGEVSSLLLYYAFWGYTKIWKPRRTDFVGKSSLAPRRRTSVRREEANGDRIKNLKNGENRRFSTSCLTIEKTRGTTKWFS